MSRTAKTLCAAGALLIALDVWAVAGPVTTAVQGQFQDRMQTRASAAASAGQDVTGVMLTEHAAALALCMRSAKPLQAHYVIPRSDAEVTALLDGAEATCNGNLIARAERISAHRATALTLALHEHGFTLPEIR